MPARSRRFQPTLSTKVHARKRCLHPLVSRPRPRAGAVSPKGDRPMVAGTFFGPVVEASATPQLFTRKKVPGLKSPSSPSSCRPDAAALHPQKGAWRREQVAKSELLHSCRGFSAAEGRLNAVGGERLAAASMGPRLFSRGRRDLVIVGQVVSGLQWGRGSSAAEGGFLRKHRQGEA